MTDIYRILARLRDEGQPAALVTIIATEGSTPREPGSKMIVTSDGRLYGTIGGGHVELDLQRRAMEVLRDGAPRVVHVNLTADLAAEEGDICGGRMDVLIEPILTHSDSPSEP